ncbi:uncharacterized protein LOC116431353 isoform X2 [Nomia melanderi]|uniref:uncharacterized protein LOC116431353 isoform X2 n=1 Tax=Nomia melanderi TaxID=2448451 RepID=UPI00130429A1|nr:uncharacterized protein LOC116431353 isoform X2 [Nomia melanderi]
MADAGVSARLSEESALSGESRVRKGSSSRLSGVEQGKRTRREEVGNVRTAIGLTLGPYKKDGEDVILEQPGNQNILMLRQLFERFLKNEREYGRVKERLEKNAKTLATVQQRFSVWIDKYFQVKSTLENARDELSKRQQIRHAMEPGDEKEKTVPEVEAAISRDIACYRKVLVNLEEEVAQARSEIRELFKQQLEMRSRLKSGFREYCKEMDALPIYSDDSMKLLLDPVERESLEATRRRFNRFQQAMMREREQRERDTMTR